MNDKYHRIVETALRLFTKEGFQNTPTATIAKEAGVANGTLFHYFKNKETLIDTIFLNSKESLISSLKAGITGEMNIPATAERMFINGIKWSVENTGLFNFFQIYSHTPFISDHTKKDGREKLTFLIEIINDGKKLGYFKDAPTDLIYTAIFGTMVQMMDFFSKDPDKIKNKKNLKYAFSLLWDAIKK